MNERMRAIPAPQKPLPLALGSAVLSAFAPPALCAYLSVSSAGGSSSNGSAFRAAATAADDDDYDYDYDYDEFLSIKGPPFEPLHCSLGERHTKQAPKANRPQPNQSLRPKSATKGDPKETGKSLTWQKL